MMHSFLISLFAFLFILSPLVASSQKVTAEGTVSEHKQTKSNLRPFVRGLQEKQSLHGTHVNVQTILEDNLPNGGNGLQRASDFARNVALLVQVFWDNVNDLKSSITPSLANPSSLTQEEMEYILSIVLQDSIVDQMKKIVEGVQDKNEEPAPLWNDLNLSHEEIEYLLSVVFQESISDLLNTLVVVGLDEETKDALKDLKRWASRALVLVKIGGGRQGYSLPTDILSDDYELSEMMLAFEQKADEFRKADDPSAFEMLGDAALQGFRDSLAKLDSLLRRRQKTLN